MSSDERNKQTCCGTCCGLLVSIGITVLIYWAIFQPHQIRATVDSATLSNLTVSNTSAAVSYHLAVSLSLYNPSKRVNIYYDTLDAELRYRDAVLGSAPSAASPTEFFQSRKTGEVVKLEFDGGLGAAVPGDAAGELGKELNGGAPVVSLELEVDVRVRYVFGSIKIRQKPQVWCALRIPVKAEGAGAGSRGAVSSGDRCRVKY